MKHYLGGIISSTVNYGSRSGMWDLTDLFINQATTAWFPSLTTQPTWVLTGTANTTFSIAGHAVGNAYAGKALYIVGGLGSLGACSVASITVGGTTLTLLVSQQVAAGSTTSHIGLWCHYPFETATTTATIELTASSTIQRAIFKVFHVSGLTAPLQVVNSTSFAPVATSSSETLTLDIPHGGIGGAAYYAWYATAAPNIFANATGVDISEVSSSNQNSMHSAFALPKSGARNGHSITTTHTTAPLNTPSAAIGYVLR